MTTKFYRSAEEPTGTHVAVTAELNGRRYAVVDSDGTAVSLHASKEAAEAEIRLTLEEYRRDHETAWQEGSRPRLRALTLVTE